MRSLRFTLPPRKTAKTAAASVEETMHPMSSASDHGRPRRRPIPARISAVRTTPTVASSPARAALRRIDHVVVVSPTSKPNMTSSLVQRRKATA
jgi:hypothetical protein